MSQGAQNLPRQEMTALDPGNDGWKDWKRGLCYEGYILQELLLKRTRLCAKYLLLLGLTMV